MKYTLEERTFPSGNVIPTAKESYKEGFKKGFFWPDAWNYHPGGPWTYGGYSCNQRDKIWASASIEAYNAWHKGWTAGKKSKQLVRESGVELPSWTDIKEFRKVIDNH